MVEKLIRKGGSFFIEEVPAEEVFTPEDFTEAHKMIIKTTDDFVKNEVHPHLDDLEHKDFELSRRLMAQAGELGLLGAEIEQEYGGAGMDSVATLLITEHIAAGFSFGLTLNAHTGIGTMPLIFFGSKAQKENYLPALVSGEKIAAYALTEPTAGTDAMSIETKATLSPDGKFYILNGTKQFITNGGFADIITTYAKVDGDKFTAFVIEKGFEGVSSGAEENKMGMRGSSTTSIVLEDAKVPVENVLFEIGRGHVVAFNILDIGRFKLAAACVGAARSALEDSVKYAKERMQFGKPICEFGLIKHKIGEMATRTYIAESMVYRTGGLINSILATVDHQAEDVGRQTGKATAEYAVECSINKVHCSEMLDYVVDEAVQMCGGYGYIEEYLAERAYRDSRICRIFEGTNEINRVITIGWLMRKALKGELPLLDALQKTSEELPALQPVSPSPEDGPLDYQNRLIDMAKKIFLFSAGAAVGKYGEALSEEQEILGHLADIAMDVYAMESGMLRAIKSIESAGEAASKPKVDMVQLYVNDAMPRIANHATCVFAGLDTGDALRERLATLEKLVRFEPINSVAVRRDIANRIIESERFIC
jgi:alkylation response protein AidB-like acyl-CoA dehydrogenase